MALLEEINYNPAEDTMQEAFDKINGAIQTINSVFGGGISGQYPVKIDDTDFNFGFKSAHKIYEIGAWNMDTTPNISVNIPDTDISKVAGCIVLIVADNGGRRELTGWDPTQLKSMGYFTLTGNLNMLLYRTDDCIFDSSLFNDPAINRGFITLFFKD